MVKIGGDRQKSSRRAFLKTAMLVVGGGIATVLFAKSRRLTDRTFNRNVAENGSIFDPRDPTQNKS